MEAGFVHSVLCGLGAYRSIRFARNYFFRRVLRERQKRLTKFYSTFVRRGDLVFDIGANRGERTEVFVRMGAHVAAVEPNCDLAERLRQEYRYAPVVVEPVAVGRHSGVMPMHHCSAQERSSMSDRWIAMVRNSRFQHLRWDRVEMVPVTTLDNLVRQHGEPAFVKLDVEGFETEVLAGLSRPLRALSFEVMPECRDIAVECISRLSALHNYEFNVFFDESFEMELSPWVSEEEILRVLDQRELESWSYADVYARIPQRGAARNVLPAGSPPRRRSPVSLHSSRPA